MSESWSFETKQVHAGATPDPTTGARATPIYQTTSLRVPRHRARRRPVRARRARQHLHADHEPDPGRARAARRRARGRASARSRSPPGRPPQTLALLNLAESGRPHRRPRASLYGGTYNLLHYTFPKLGIEVTFVDDPDDLDAWRAAIRPNTKLFFAETLGNPKGNVLDFEGVADVAHEAGVPLIIDNTVATPYLLRPLEHGADIVVHSATKFLGGHGTSIGGVIVDGGTFDYGRAADRFPGFTEPDPSYHGLRLLAEALGPRVRTSSRCGCSCCATSARRSRRSTRSCSSRASRRCRCAWSGTSQNAQARRGVAGGAATRWSRCTTPGLPSSPWHARASRSTCPSGAGAVVAFELQGGVEAGKRFVDALELFSHLANIGDVRSLVDPPAPAPRTASSSGEEQLATGVTPGLVRLSVGHREHRRHPRRPRRRASAPPRRLGDPDRDGAPSRHRRVAGGRPAGPPAVRDGWPSRCRSRPAASCPAVTVAYETWGTLDARRAPTRCSCCTRSPATATSPGPPAPGHPTAGLVGRPWSGPGARSTPTAASSSRPTCSAAARAPPGRRRPRRTGGRGAAASRSSRSATRCAAEAALADALGIDAVGVRRRRLDGRDAGARVGGDRARPGRRGCSSWPARRRRRRSRSRWCAPQLRGDPRRPATGAAATTTTPPPGQGPHVGLGIARRIGAPDLPQRVRARAAVRPRAAGRRGPGRAAAATRSSPTSTTTPTSWCAGSTRRTYVRLTETMNAHDVGRGRGGVPPALARVTARTLVAGVVLRPAVPAGAAGGAGRRASPARASSR